MSVRQSLLLNEVQDTKEAAGDQLRRKDARTAHSILAACREEELARGWFGDLPALTPGAMAAFLALSSQPLDPMLCLASCQRSAGAPACVTPSFAVAPGWDWLSPEGAMAPASEPALLPLAAS